MQLKNVFAKPIDREIQGVIKVGQDEKDDIKQDLDEYVVTNELQKYFSDFFAAYLKSINGPTDKMGVWISGFFGSGKSHFLKILSYLLNSKVEINGQTAIEFFKAQGKIADPMTIANMDRAASVPTDVILFNIDAESKSGNKADENAILNVFMQQFNKMQGFTDANFYLADLERLLVSEGQYDDFKQAYAELNPKGVTWIEGRNRFAFEGSIIAKALERINFRYDMPDLKAPYSKNIKEFAQLVADYIESKGGNQHVVFLVDEVGQFIGDDVRRMLNLQTVVEELGSATHGKAWVIVTSQQSIDKVTKHLSGTDFSKIQGRFDTKISMSSSNVDEVIKRRLLDKTDDAKMYLEGLFEKNQNPIRNKFNFKGDRKWVDYKNEVDFAEIYPFVPYQFELLQTVLTAVREHGSDGKHLSEGERSMLAIFKEAAVKFSNQEVGKLIPFSAFFDGLENFLDHEHRIVISNAIKNSRVNPDETADSFAIRVFTTLFMIKYVDEFEKSLENITTLMVSDSDEDIIVLTDKVKTALNDLVSQGFVEKTSHGYEFLTNQEQDIKNQIDKQIVDENEIAKELGTYFFNDKETIKSVFDYPKLRGNYSFKFNLLVDEAPTGASGNKLTVKIVTPLNDNNRNETQLKMESSNDKIIIDMSTNNSYIDEMRQALRIQKFLTSNSSTFQDAKSKALIAVQQEERTSLIDAVKKHVRDELENADIYVSMEKIENGSTFSSRIGDAMQRTVDGTYRNLDYITAPKNDRDIVELFKKNDELDVNEQYNEKAVIAVRDRIQIETSSNAKVNLKTILDKFKDAPYGYNESDTEWLVAKLFTTDQIGVKLDGENISRINTRFSSQELANLFIKKANHEKLALSIKEAISPKKIKALKEVASEVYEKKSFESTTDDGLVSELQKAIESEVNILQNFESRNSKFPGHVYLEEGIKLGKRLLVIKEVSDFYNEIDKNQDQLLDWHENMLDYNVYEFYRTQSHQDIWKKGIDYIEIYAKSREYAEDEVEFNDVARQLIDLVKSGNANKVREISAVNERFKESFTNVFDKQAQDRITFVNEKITSGQSAVDGQVELSENVKNTLNTEFNTNMHQLISDIENSTTLEELNAKSSRVERVYEMLFNKIQSEVAKSIAIADTPVIDDENIPNLPVNPVKPVKKVKVQPITTYTSSNWRISSEADLDRELAALKSKILQQLNDGETSYIDLKF